MEENDHIQKEKRRKDFEDGINCLRLVDIDKIQSVADETGCIFSFRQTNPTAVSRLDEEAFPKRIDNHAKSSEQDGLITFNSSLSKLTKVYKEETNSNEKIKVLNKINSATKENEEIKENNEQKFTKIQKKLSHALSKIEENKNNQELEQLYYEWLEQLLEYANGRRIQRVIEDKKTVDGKEYEVFYFKKNNVDKKEEIDVELDGDGNPIIYLKNDDNYYKVTKYSMKGEPEIDSSKPVTSEEITRLYSNFTLEPREVFATLQFKTEEIVTLLKEGKYEEVKKIISLDNDYKNIDNTKYFSISPNTADYDQLFVGTGAKTFDFIKNDIEKLKNNYFDNMDLNTDDENPSILQTFNKKTKNLELDDAYESVYFQITEDPKRRINDKIAECEKTNSDLKNFKLKYKNLNKNLNDALNENHNDASNENHNYASNENYNDASNKNHNDAYNNQKITKIRTAINELSEIFNQNKLECQKNDIDEIQQNIKELEGLDEVDFLKNTKNIKTKLESLIIKTNIEIKKNEIELNKFKSLGTPHITTQYISDKTEGVINHGPESYHYYPEGFKDEERIVTIVPKYMMETIKENKGDFSYIRIHEGNSETNENKVDLLVLEGINGVVEFVNFCNKKNLAFSEINILWNLDVNYDTSPSTLIVTDKPSISEEEYKALIDFDKRFRTNIMDKFIRAERLRLQPDYVVIPNGCNLDEDEVRKYTMKKNLEIARKEYINIYNNIINKNNEIRNIMFSNKNEIAILKNEIKTGKRLGKKEDLSNKKINSCKDKLEELERKNEDLENANKNFNSGNFPAIVESRIEQFSKKLQELEVLENNICLQGNQSILESLKNVTCHVPQPQSQLKSNSNFQCAASRLNNNLGKSNNYQRAYIVKPKLNQNARNGIGVFGNGRGSFRNGRL